MGKTRAKPDMPSKAERKFEKKLEFYTKVRDNVASLSTTKSITKKKKLRSRQKKLKAYDLSALSQFLPELKEKKQPNPDANFKLNCKNRTKLMVEEAKRMNEVHNDPAFQKDPWAFIHDSLKSMYPPEEKSMKKTNKDGKKKRKKGKKSKGSDASSDG